MVLAKCPRIKTYSAKQIMRRAQRGEHVTKTQLAEYALDFLKKKYKHLRDGDRFYHVGNGEWMRVKRD